MKMIDADPITVEITTIEDEVEAVERMFAPVQENAVTVQEPGGTIIPAQSMLPVERVLGAVISAASDPSVDVAKMRELLGLQKDLMAMQAEQQFNGAFHRLMLKLPRIRKDGTVEYKDKKTERVEKAFKFATYEAIDAAIRPLLQEEGFVLSFDSVPRVGDGGGITVTGTLSHVGGHRRTASIPLALDNSGGKNNIQGMGSTFSYGKRYTTTMLLNIVTEGDDDDGKRGGTKYITEDQVLEIQAMAIETKTDEGRFLEMMTNEARSFEEIEKDDYARLLNMLISKKRQMVKRTTGEPT